VPPASALPSATPVAAAAGAFPALGGDPAQYALTKLRLQEAHSLTKGNNVLVAVIDSGVDAGHPELRGVIAGTFDALNKAEKPHMHGTAIAGAIAARSRLMGVAPAARILAIRAFGASGNTAEGTTFAILKGIEHATSQGARVINMSFNGPADPGMARQLAAARARGIVLVAAVGNLGQNSPPQYPAADPNVIAVSATDAEDNLFKASNRGGHIAVAAPGVDILVPVPNANYQVTSGTSFAAAHVSGIVALILERKPSLGPDAVRKILLSTAKDLGPVGQDDQFGAGLADAYQAILALEPRSVAGPDLPAEPLAAAR
jgi:subtilisin family serine protease